MLNVFKKSNQKISRKQFVIKNTLIALLYPVIPLASLIIISYSGTGSKDIMVIFSIISLCSIGFFIHLMAYYVLKKESYDDYVKCFKKPNNPNYNDFDRFYFSKGTIVPNYGIDNEHFKDITQEFFEGRRMIYSIQDVEKTRGKIDVVLRDIENDEFFPDPIEITVGSYMDGKVKIQLPISKDELYYFLSKQRTNKVAELAELKHKFNDKFQNNKPKDQND